MLNIILIARSQERARRLLRELWENNQDTFIKGYPTILTDVDQTMQIAAFSKESHMSIKCLGHVDQIFLEEGINMTNKQASDILMVLRHSCVPDEYKIQVLKEIY